MGRTRSAERPADVTQRRPCICASGGACGPIREVHLNIQRCRGASKARLKQLVRSGFLPAVALHCQQCFPLERTSTATAWHTTQAPEPLPHSALDRPQARRLAIVGPAIRRLRIRGQVGLWMRMMKRRGGLSALCAKPGASWMQRRWPLPSQILPGCASSKRPCPAADSHIAAHHGIALTFSQHTCGRSLDVMLGLVVRRAGADYCLAQWQL